MRGPIRIIPLICIGVPVWAQEAAGADAGGVPWWVWLLVVLAVFGAVYYALKHRGPRGKGG